MEYEELDAVDEGASAGAAERLKLAREAKGMSIDQVAAKTRITTNHLEMIEAGRFTSLPGRTYAIGFAKNFARVVGENEEEIGAAVRSEFPTLQETMAAERGGDFEPGDPGKVPSAGLTWLSVLAVVLLGVGSYMFYNAFYGTGASPGSLVDQASAALAGEDEGAEGAVAEQAAASGPVIFTATEDGTWVRFYDGSGNVLLEKIMASGESWTVPADAESPQIRTGRPYAFDITIGGRKVPVLDETPRVISDVEISAEALLARAADESAANIGEEAGAATGESAPSV